VYCRNGLAIQKQLAADFSLRQREDFQMLIVELEGKDEIGCGRLPPQADGVDE
jgi:hypothetical protein